MGNVGRLWLISSLLLAAALFGIAARGGWSSGKAVPPEKVGATETDGSAYGAGLTVQRAGKYLGVPIKDFPVGTWVLAENPETEGNFGFDYGELNADELRIVRLRLEKPLGGVLWIERIELAEFLAEDGVAVGSSQYEEYEDLGIEGEAEVVEISPCPPLTARPSERHCLVTSKFTHDAANVLDLTLSGLDESIGVTANHPIWSEDRQSFIPAGELRPGERLLSASGSLTSVASLAPRPGLHPVYNLEVDGKHVYHVSPAGLLVHNGCARYGVPGSGPEHHIASQFANANRGFTQPWTQMSQQILGNARVHVKNSGFNKVFLPGHKGPHTELYHQRVFERLASAVRGENAGTFRYMLRVRKELRSIAKEILADPAKISGVGL